MWPDGEQIIDSTVKGFLSEQQSPHEIIQAKYELEMNGGLTIKDRLNVLKRDILESGLKELT